MQAELATARAAAAKEDMQAAYAAWRRVGAQLRAVRAAAAKAEEAAKGASDNSAAAKLDATAAADAERAAGGAWERAIRFASAERSEEAAQAEMATVQAKLTMVRAAAAKAEAAAYARRRAYRALEGAFSARSEAVAAIGVGWTRAAWWWLACGMWAKRPSRRTMEMAALARPARRLLPGTPERSRKAIPAARTALLTCACERPKRPNSRLPSWAWLPDEQRSGRLAIPHRTKLIADESTGCGKLQNRLGDSVQS